MIVGVASLIGYIVGLVLWLSMMPFEGLNILYFILFVLAGPALGLSCMYVSVLLDTTEQLEERVKRLEKETKIEDSASTNKQ